MHDHLQRMDNEITKRFPNASASFIKRNPHLAGVPQRPERKPDPGDEPVAKGSRAAVHPVRRLVRFTVMRCQLLDDENVWTKYFTDALRYAGILYEDSPRWCKVEVIQKLVQRPEDEATLVEIT